MKNPFGSIEDTIEEKVKSIGAEIERRVFITLLRETAAMNLSRLDTDKSQQYLDAMKAFGK